MPLAQLDHCLVLSNDIDGTRDFYRDVLGLRPGPRPALVFPGYWMYLGDFARIHIADWRSYSEYAASIGMPVSKAALGGGSIDHIAFSGTDYPSIIARFENYSATWGENSVPEIKLRQLFLSDPNGVTIEINLFDPM